ncbi:MAG: SurA N-terminal domain-containing protein [Bdellovibrionota bacterium]
MIKLIRANRKSIVGVFLMLLLSASMLLFGTDPINSSSDNYALKVDDATVSSYEFSQRRRELEQRLEQQFGPTYYQLIDAGVINLNQQVMDALLEQMLLNKFAAELGTTAGNTELGSFIQTSFAQDGRFDQNLYANYLSSQGLTAPQFEARIRDELVTQGIDNLIKDISQSTKAEAAKRMRSELTAYDANYIEFDPANFKAKVAEISQDDLMAFYEDNATEFETPAQVEYEYLLISPEQVKDKVEVLDEDIEIYYLEHISDYQTPSKVTASHIQINYTNDSSPEKVSEIKALAQNLHNRVQNGEAISELALEYSDDITTKALGGSLGTFSSGTHSKEIEAAVFGQTEPGLAPLVEADYGFNIVYIDEIIPAEAKPLEGLKAEIKAKLIERDAPAYARAEAEELFDKALEQSLSDIIEGKNLEVKKTDGYVNENTDPEPELSGLSKLVLNSPGDSVQIHDFKDNSLIVKVLNYKDAEIPEFAQVKDKIKEMLTSKKSYELAKESADELLTEITEEKPLKLVAKEKGIPVKEARNLVKSETSKDIFTTPALREALFSLHSETQVPESVVEANGKFYIVQAAKITPPTIKEDDEDLMKYQKEQSQVMARLVRQSLLTVLKQESEIDIDESLLVQ